jgi:type II secretory pathway predicted ATPase ExeA
MVQTASRFIGQYVIYTLLIIDEAQNLSIEVLEEIKLLTNFENDDKKFIQIILSGHSRFAQIESGFEHCDTLSV